MNVLTLIKQYACFMHLLLILSLFSSSRHIKKWTKVEWLKWNRIELIFMLPIFMLKTQGVRA